MTPQKKYLITLFFGWTGAHKFIEGKIGLGILYLCTFGLWCVGWIIDANKAHKAAQQANRQAAKAKTASAPAVPTSLNDYFKDDYRFHPYEPHFVDGATRQYRYQFSFTPVDQDSANALWALTGGSRTTAHELAPGVENGVVQLDLHGMAVGTTDFKTDMFSDWIERGDPLKVFLIEADRDAGNFVAAVDFYKNRCEANAWREQTVVALNSYKHEDRQEGIGFIEKGEEVEICVQDDNAHSAAVTHMGTEIGTLPSEIVRRIEDEGAALAVFERGECVGEDSSGDTVERPYIRIYW